MTKRRVASIYCDESVFFESKAKSKLPTKIPRIVASSTPKPFPAPSLRGAAVMVGRRRPWRAVAATSVVWVVVALLAILVTLPRFTNAQLASGDLAVADVAPPDVDVTPDDPATNTSDTTSDPGSDADTGSADDSYADPYADAYADPSDPGGNGGTGNSDGTDTPDQQSVDLTKLGLETKFPDPAFVGAGVSVGTGKGYDDLEGDIAAGLGVQNVGSGNGTGAVDGNGTGGTTNSTGDTTGGVDATLSDEEKQNSLTFDPRSFLYDFGANTDLVDPRLACKRGCVDPSVDVTLVWCLDAVKYKYCNRLASNDKPTVTVLDMEEGAIAAYMALAQRVPTPNAPECRPMLRKWMCREFFTQCNTDETAFYPVCVTTCAAAKYACGSPNWLECDQEVEELDGNAPDAWYVDGDRNNKYIRGVKPDGAVGSPVFESDVLRCTGGSGHLDTPGVWSLVLLAVSILGIW